MARTNVSAPGRSIVEDRHACLNHAGSTYSIVNNSGAGSIFDFSGTAEFTWTGWFMKASQTSLQMLLNKGNTNNNGYEVFYENTTGKIYAKGLSTGSAYAISNLAIQPNRIYHFAIVFSHSARTIKMYLDGVLQSTVGTTPNSGFGSTNGALAFGYAQDLTVPFSLFPWYGWLDDYRFYRTTALTAAQVLEDMIGKYPTSAGVAIPPTEQWLFDDGAGATLKARFNSNYNGVITSPLWIANQRKAKRTDYWQNYVSNGGFDYAPPFTTATNTQTKWIDGTAAGSSTNKLFGWAVPTGAISASANAQFDSSVSYSGGSSIKLSTLDASGVVAVAQALVTTAPVLATDKIFVLKPSTSYTISGYIKTNNVATDSAYISFREYNTALGVVVTTSSTKYSGTNDWTFVTFNVTTSSTTVYGTLILFNFVAGNIGQAWFDEVSVKLTTAPTRASVTSRTAV